MYLAKYVGGWSAVQIGKFYNGRHHTTVLHAIRKIEKLRAEDESIDALLEVLTATLSEEVGKCPTESTQIAWPAELIEAIADRVLGRLAELRREESVGSGHCTVSGTC